MRTTSVDFPPRPVSPLMDRRWLMEVVSSVYGDVLWPSGLPDRVSEVCTQAADDFSFVIGTPSAILRVAASFLLAVDQLAGEPGHPSCPRPRLARNLLGALLSPFGISPRAIAERRIDDELLGALESGQVDRLHDCIRRAWGLDPSCFASPPGAAPPPEKKDVQQEWRRARALLDGGELSEYAGQFVAVLDGRVVGTGDQEWRLREEVAASASVHPERVVVLYVDDGGSGVAR